MTAHKPGDPTTLNRLYGRSQGKPLRAGQQRLVDTLLPQIAMPAEGPITGGTRSRVRSDLVSHTPTVVVSIVIGQIPPVTSSSAPRSTLGNLPAVVRLWGRGSDRVFDDREGGVGQFPAGADEGRNDEP